MRARDYLARRRAAKWAMLLFIVFPLAAQADVSSVVVDGQYDDWDLDKNRLTPMQKEQGCTEKTLPKVYLHYDSINSTLFVLVLGKEGLQGGLNKPVVNIYSLGQNILGNRNRVGQATNFSWVMDNSTCVGWEGSYQMKSGRSTCDTARKKMAKRKKASEVEVIDTESFFNCK